MSTSLKSIIVYYNNIIMFLFTCSILFWTDWAEFYIGVANLDGSNAGMFAYVDYGWLNGLAIDYTGNDDGMCVHRVLLKFPFKGGASQFLKLSLMKILLIPARSHTFVEIDHEIISTVILLPSAESFKKGCCQ